MFKFKFGKKIWDKIDDLMHPQFPGESPINPFDFWGGANFKLKIRQVEGYRNYDKSEFEVPSPHRKGDDKVLEAIYKQLYPLKSLLDSANYKTYNELSKKLGDVLGEVIDFERVENESTEAEKNSAEPVHSPPSRAEAAEKTLIDEDAGGKDLSLEPRLKKQIPISFVTATGEVHNRFNSPSYSSCDPIQYQIMVSPLRTPTALQPKPTRTEKIGRTA